MIQLFFDSGKNRWLLFQRPLKLLQANEREEVEPLLKEVVRTQQEGRYVAGFLSYELFSGFECSSSDDAFPLALFGVYDEVKEQDHPRFRPLSGPCETGNLVCTTDKKDYLRNFQTIQEKIVEGELEQINYTIRLKSRFNGDPLEWFCSRVEGAQATERPGDYLAYLEWERWSVASLSPELFFSLSSDGTILSRPMKGTSPRLLSADPAEQSKLDRAGAAALASDLKNREENRIAVELALQEFQTIAHPGTANITARFEVEKHPTLFQMTSCVEAKTSRNLFEIMTKLFPPVSIVGVPRQKARHWIRQLENSARRVYSGSIGFLRPDLSMQFNVAIRTAIFNYEQRSVEYGVGSGVEALSVPEEEWNELRLKAKVADRKKPFSLFTTMRLCEGKIYLFPRHLDRLVKSAVAFFFIPSSEEKALRQKLEREFLSHAALYPQGQWRLRADLFSNGELLFECVPIAPLRQPVRVALATVTIDSENPFSRHKTAERGWINRVAETRSPLEKSDDVVMINQRGELVESSRANILLEIEGVYYTPPLQSGCLNGVLRSELLDRGEIVEKTLYPSDFQKATSVQLINALRGRMEAVFVPLS